VLVFGSWHCNWCNLRTVGSGSGQTVISMTIGFRDLIQIPDFVFSSLHTDCTLNKETRNVRPVRGQQDLVRAPNPGNIGRQMNNYHTQQVESRGGIGATRELYRNLSDCDLVRRCKIKDHLAFEEVVRRYERDVYGLLYQLAPDWRDVSDLLQEVLIRLWRSIGHLQDPSRFRSWLRRIVTHLFFDELRRRPQNTYIISLDQPMDYDDSGDGLSRDVMDHHTRPDEAFQNSELASTIRSAMAKLPHQFRVAIVLRELQGLSYQEIGELTDTDLGTVKSRISRARRRLQKALNPYLKEESSNARRIDRKKRPEVALTIDPERQFVGCYRV
jgi:RNA polymerase sigma-70 factor (ECF subfamily)